MVRLLGLACWTCEGLEADERTFQVMGPCDRRGREGVKGFAQVAWLKRPWASWMSLGRPPSWQGNRAAIT